MTAYLSLLEGAGLLHFRNFRLGGGSLRLGSFGCTLDSFLEAAEAFAEPLAQFWKLSGAEDQAGQLRAR